MDTKILPVKPTVKYGDFEKLDIREGGIEKVEDVQGLVQEVGTCFLYI